MSDNVEILRAYCNDTLDEIGNAGEIADEIEQLLNTVQDQNGLINRLKHELQSIEYALSDVRINLTMTSTEVAHGMRCEIDALRSALARLYEWSHVMTGDGIRFTGDHPLAVAKKVLDAAPKPGERDDPR